MTAKPGLSGLVRLRDEEVWAHLALDSFVGWCDELIVVTNRCSDCTPKIVADFAWQHSGKVRVFDYDHEIWPMGPGHDRVSGDDPRSSAAYYNWVQAKATRTHAVKLDGDMIMMDWAGTAIRKLLDDGQDRIRFEGIDLVGPDVAHTGSHPLCRTNGVYKLGNGVRYEQGPLTQNLKGV
ncbi:MAG TPA: hypothetical protein VMW31_04605, partial [Devosiaceae bacterium]|nr:hypothetical protein [Devosiaceae bacterium]